MWYKLKASIEVYIHLGRTFAGYASALLPKLHYVSPMTEDSPNLSRLSPHRSVSFGTIGFLLFPENHPASSHPSYQISQFLTLPISDSFHCSHFSVRNTPWVFRFFVFPPLSLPLSSDPRLVRSSLPPALLFHLQLPMKWCKSTDHPKLNENSSHVCLPQITVLLSGMSLSLPII